MGARSAIDRLKLCEVVSIGGHRLVHVFYDRSFQGAIHEAGGGWRAKLHPVDLGDFQTPDEAIEAVVNWFAGLNTDNNKDHSETGVTRSENERAEQNNIAQRRELGYAPGF